MTLLALDKLLKLTMIACLSPRNRTLEPIPPENPTRFAPPDLNLGNNFASTTLKEKRRKKNKIINAIIFFINDILISITKYEIKNSYHLYHSHHCLRQPDVYCFTAK